MAASREADPTTDVEEAAKTPPSYSALVGLAFCSLLCM